jgi:hypothetical protein
MNGERLAGLYRSWSLLPTSPFFEILLFQSYLSVFISLAQFLHSPPQSRFVDGDPFPISCLTRSEGGGG